MSGHAAALDSSTKAEEDPRKMMIDKLERMELETMHKMVTEVEVPVGDGLPDAICKFLYLTNKQAADFPDASYAKAKAALDLGNPSLVIRLMPSQLGKAWWSTFPNYARPKQSSAGPSQSAVSAPGDALPAVPVEEFVGRFPAKRTPELSLDAAEEVEKKLHLFAKEVLLPLALRTKALVIGQEACGLTSAFVAVAGRMQNRLKEDCPFRLLIFARAYSFHHMAGEKTSVAHLFRHGSQGGSKTGCRAWARAEKELQVGLEKLYGKDPAYHPRGDLFKGRYSLILFENLTKESRIAEETMVNFQSEFIQKLSDVPIVALQTYGVDRMNLAAVADHVSRRFPCMLLDSRKTAIPKKEQMGDKEADFILALSKLLRQRDGALQARNVPDWYQVSAMALVKRVMNEAYKVDNEGRSRAQRQKRLSLQRAIKQCGKCQDDDHADDERGERQERLMEFAKQATNLILDYSWRQVDTEKKDRYKRFDEAKRRIGAATNWKDFRNAVSESWPAIRGCAFHNWNGLDTFNLKWCEKCERVPENGLFELKVQEKQIDDVDVDEAKKELIKLVDNEHHVSKTIDDKRLKRNAWVTTGKWLAVYEILKSSDVHAENLYDFAACKNKLQEIARVDYLPDSNSYEALLLLDRAWRLHANYMKYATWYKVFMKWLYRLQLVVQFCIVLVVTLNPENKKVIALCISLLATFLSCVMSFAKPDTKWRALRGGAMRVESEIWRFRARMGAYRRKETMQMLAQQDERHAERVFAAKLAAMEEDVRSSSSLGRTVFFAEKTIRQATGVARREDNRREAKSGEKDDQRGRNRRGAKNKGETQPEEEDELEEGQDNGHSPVSADDYVEHRLRARLRFYQDRIPRYSASYYGVQVPGILAPIVTLVLALLANSGFGHTIKWAAAASTLTSLIMAYSHFLNLDKKLDRYSNLVQNLEDTAEWWASLAPDIKERTLEVNRLVGNVEDVIMSEVDEWLASFDSKSTGVLVEGELEKGGKVAGQVGKVG